MKKLGVLFFSCLLLHPVARAQEFIAIWPDGKIPNTNGKPVRDSIFNERIYKVSRPGIYAFPVPKADNKGTAVLISPGGGYERVSYIYSGFQVARWFNAHGINAFVLAYRLPHQENVVVKQLAPVQDAQRAMKFLHAHAARFGIDTARTGVMGISAGGHVAALLSTGSEDLAMAGDTVDDASFKPAFQLLLSPVITMGAWAHKGSRRLFLGADTSAAMIKKYSAENWVQPSTPPAFMVHAQNDNSVPVQNSVLYFNALIDQKVSASLHVFPQGGHSIGLVDNPGSTELWLPLLLLWLQEKGFTKPLK